jgi:glycine/D-amino acid oxidase-like deaminating enzyme
LKPDVLIVGQGLAGSLLAWEFIQRGVDVRVVDRGHAGSASSVAAGLFTPITGKRFVLTWKAKELLDCLVDYYPTLERAFDASFFHPLDTLRIFLSEEEKALWMEKQSHPSLEPYRGLDFGPDERDMPVHHPWGGFALHGSGWVDINGLIGRMRKAFLTRGILEEREVNPMDLPDAERVIFCEGYRSAVNPWFKHLPFRNAHGDLLTLRIPDLSSDHILSSGVFCLPLGGGLFRVGATFNWNVHEPGPTVIGRDELLKRVRGLISAPMELVDNQGGIRPVAKQRVPVAGFLPGDPRIGILNGFGAKGVLYAPYYARQLADHMLDGEPIDREVELAGRLRLDEH